LLAAAVMVSAGLTYTTAEVSAALSVMNFVASQAANGPELFVTRLYSVCLGRQPDEEGLSYWTGYLRNKSKTGGEVAKGFLGSAEFTSLGYDDETYVSCLYKVFFDREPDEEGLNTWLKALSSGTSRNGVVNGFINSTEWANLCAVYGIESGGTAAVTITIEDAGEVSCSSDDNAVSATVTSQVNSEAVANFVRGLYDECLGRSADESGLNYWCSQIASGKVTGKQAAQGFFYSQEFLNALPGMTEDEVITKFYRVFLSRYPDADGLNYWKSILASGGSADELFNGFADSQEFAQKCSEYGITCGDHIKVANVQPYWSAYTTGLAMICNRWGVTMDQQAVLDSIVSQCNYWTELEYSNSSDSLTYRMGSKSLLPGGTIDCSGFVTAIYKRALGTQTMAYADVNNPSIYTSSMTYRGTWRAGLDQSPPTVEGVYYINGDASRPIYTDKYGISTSYAANTYQWQFYLDSLGLTANSSLTWRIENYTQEEITEILNLRGYKPGDIVMWYTSGVDAVHSDHIGIYAGDGYVWHCTSYLSDGIQYTPITYMGSYEGTSLQYVRIYHMS